MTDPNQCFADIQRHQRISAEAKSALIWYDAGSASIEILTHTGIRSTYDPLDTNALRRLAAVISASSAHSGITAETEAEFLGRRRLLLGDKYDQDGNEYPREARSLNAKRTKLSLEDLGL